MKSDATPDLRIDARGTFCPIPVIKTSEAIRNLKTGSVVEVISDDPAIKFDLPAWCRSTGHEIISERIDGDDFYYHVQKCE